jgi:hypothetical protein
MVGLLGLAVSAILGYFGDRFYWPYAMTVSLTVLVLPLISFLAGVVDAGGQRDFRRIRDTHLALVDHVDLDSDIVPSISAR